MSKLPVEEIEYKQKHPICENCGAEMKEIGKEKAYEVVVENTNYIDIEKLTEYFKLKDEKKVIILSLLYCSNYIKRH